MIGWCLLTLGLCYGVCDAPVTRPLRRLLRSLPGLVGRFFAALLECLACVGAWSGLVAAWMLGDGARLTGAWWLTSWLMGAGLGFGILLLSPMNAAKNGGA
jgi:hypothetical protein